MGYALAEAARARGADVVLVSGPTELTPPDGLATKRVETTEDMQRALEALVPSADALIMSAAPADYRPKHAAPKKRPRGNGAYTVELEATPDILTSLKRRKGMVVVGFALETGNGLANARTKMQNKALDFVILNDATEPGAGFEVPTNRVTILGPGGKQVDLPLLPKRDVAERILDVVEEAL
jgi:phosphopantothenoylcysteine decarboxylase/phosphopantothenate--cysteine ligase